MNVRVLQHISSYGEFKQNADFKEYRTIPGIFLKIFGHAQSIVDERGLTHYVRKEDLRSLDANLYQLPDLNHKILINKVFKCEELDLKFPVELSDEEQTTIQAFIEKKYTHFSRSGQDHKVFDALGDLSFSVEFRKTEDKLLIFLEIPGVGSYDLIEGKEKELQFYWPEDVSLLGITEDEQDVLSTFLEEYLEGLGDAELMHPLKVKRKIEGIPLSILLVPGVNGRVEKILLLPRSEKIGVVAKGSYKAVKKAYDLTSGEFLVKKIMSKKEGQIVKELQDQKRVLKLRVETEKAVNGEEMLRYYEPLADGTIENLIRSPLTSEQKIQVVKQLLKALTAFHKKTASDGRPFYHGDLKPANILFTQDPDGTIQLFLADFGYTNRRSGVAGSPDWVSPEQGRRWHQYLLHLPYDKVILGNALDVWATGLIIASLLSEEFFPGAFIKVEGKEKVLESLSLLKQKSVDEQIRHYRRHSSRTLRPVWDIVRGMLSVDPEDRWTAEEALERFQALSQ